MTRKSHPTGTRSGHGPWKSCRRKLSFQEIVQLVGSDALPESEQVTIEVARMIREIFLQQNAYDAVDTFCDMKKQYDMLKSIKTFAELAYAAQIAGVSPTQINGVKAKNEPAPDQVHQGLHARTCKDHETNGR